MEESPPSPSTSDLPEGCAAPPKDASAPALLPAICTWGLCLVSLAAIATPYLFPAPQREPRATEIFAYPPEITLPSWQLLETQGMTTGNQPPGWHYRLQHRRLEPKMTAQILTVYQPYSDGNVSRLVAAYTEAKPAMVYIHTLEHPETGYFGAFLFQDQAYLSACVNPRGRSTVTEQQFAGNRYRYNLQLWKGLSGQGDWSDSRCLWTLLSTAIAPQSSPAEIAETFENLETAWVEWCQWWKHKF